MKIKKTFEILKSRNEAALILYMTSGYPDIETSMQNIRFMAENGADIIEVGIPFSDPIADGSVIQYASHIALQNQINLSITLSGICSLNLKVPIVIMSYVNPLMAYGIDRLFPDLEQAGVSGLIVPDLPVGEADNRWLSLSNKVGIDLIFLAAPTSPVKRIRKIVDRSSGFVYCVSLKGTTGVRQGLPTNVVRFLKKVRGMTTKPIGVGFGISMPDHIKILRDHADGIIVGSRMIQAVRDGENLAELITQLKAETRRERTYL